MKALKMDLPPLTWSIGGRVEVRLSQGLADIPLPVLNAGVQTDHVGPRLHVQRLVGVHPRQELDLAALEVEGVFADVDLTDGLGQDARLPRHVALVRDADQHRVAA